MNITEFLLERIAEDEREATVCLGRPHYSTRRWTRMLSECEAKRAIVKQHEQWPVLTERPAPEVGVVNPYDLQATTLRMSKHLDWLTEQEYRKKFGDEPPTAPMLKELAAIYSDHPDYREEWRP